jgi:Ulp1 family protease
MYIDMHQRLLASDTSFDAKQSFGNKYLFKYANPETAKTFIFAMNPGMHWIAFKIDFHKKYIATMCSMQNTLDTEARKLKACISTFVPDARSFRHISVTVPHQKNPYDCGPLCCMFMLFLAQHDISAETRLEYDTLPTAAEMRLRIFADIAEKKLTILGPTC